MKRNTFLNGWIALVLLFSILAGACVKTATPPGTASLTIINAVVGSGDQPLITNFDGGNLLYYNYTAQQLPYGSFSVANQFHFYSGALDLALFHYPDTTVHDSPVLKVKLDIAAGSIYSLFLTGTLASPDTVFTKDQLVYFPPSDSSAAIRFANLSPGSAPVSVNIQGQPNGSEVANLPYKGITEFKRYAATSSVSDPVFEFRDAATGTLIRRYFTFNFSGPGDFYDPNNWLYRNNTISLIGSPTGTVGDVQRTFVIPHF